MKILGIETSCDETAAAVVEDGSKILSNVVATSSEMHAKTGGIIPEQAARQQVKSIIPVIEQSLSDAFNSKSPISKRKAQSSAYHQSLITSINAIAVTVGPGLVGSLLVGIETAKSLSYLWKMPIIPVNHMVAHIYANWIDTGKSRTKNSEHKNALPHTPNTNHQPLFPALALVVSGGHTDLVLLKNHGHLEWIGGTRDDAAGEAFDKCARLLGLPYPGGPAISVCAEKFIIQNFLPADITHQELRPDNFQLDMFPRPLINKDNFDWSFSGLKTAVFRKIGGKKLTAKEKQRIAAEVQEAIVDSLVEKSIKAIIKFKPKSFLLSGGVAANKRLREKLKKRIKSERLRVKFHVPPIDLCTDNGASIATAAFFNFRPISWKKIVADSGLTIIGEI